MILPASGSPNLRYPVLLIHGLFSSSRTWRKTVRVLSEDFDLKYGGEVSAAQSTGFTADGSTNTESMTPADLYTWNFSSNHNLSYRQQALELIAGIEKIKAVNRVSQVVLVGHSMGGLAARAVVQLAGSKDIYALITLGTPHYGSPLALLKDSTHHEARRLVGRIQKILGSSERKSEEKIGFFRRIMMKLFRVSTEAQAELDRFFASEAFAELAPGSAALEELNQAPLPHNIRYAFITGSLTNFSAIETAEQKAGYAKLRRFWIELTEKVVQNLSDKYLRDAYEVFGAYLKKYVSDGDQLNLAQLIDFDGAVPVYSQMLAHFKNPPLVHAVLPVYASHTRLTKRPAKIFQALAVCGVVGPRGTTG